MSIRLPFFGPVRKQKTFTAAEIVDCRSAAIQPLSELFGTGTMRGYSSRSFGRRVLLAGIGLMTSLAGDLVAAPVQAAPLPDPVRAGISRSLADSAIAWSGNDLDGFMESYEDSPETTYVTAHRLVRGFAAIKAMYASRFGGKASLGRLSFSLEEVRPLGQGFALAVGRYELVRADLPTPATGIFTLVFHRTRAGWKIVSDHTSS